VPFLRNATRIYECLLQAELEEGCIELVLNRVAANYERITPHEVERHFGRPVFGAIPNDYKHVTASRDLGHPILTAAPNSPARLAIQRLARRLGGPLLNAAQTPRAKRSLLTRFFGHLHKDEQPAVST